MPHNQRYDFSEESGLKATLLEELKNEYAKSALKAVVPLCDDQLELIAAAGLPNALSVCPYSAPCCDCQWYQGCCVKHMVKDEGGKPHV